MQILIVDDDPIFVDLLSSYIVAMGYPKPASELNGEDALNLLAGNGDPFDTFLIDIHMPGMGGIELCKKIRAMTAHRKAPIIVVTASAKSELMEKAFAAGATDFFHKPLDVVEFGTRLNIANLLNDSIIREREAVRSLDELNASMSFEFGERVALTSSGVVEFLAFENKMLKLKDGCYSASLFSVEISGARNLFRSYPPTRFLRFLEQVADALQNHLFQFDSQVVYIGKGTFFGVIFGRHKLNFHELEASLKSDLLSCDAVIDLPTPTVTNIVAKAVSSKRVWTKSSIIRAVFEAQERLEKKSLFPAVNEDSLLSKMGNEFRIEDAHTAA